MDVDPNRRSEEEESDAEVAPTTFLPRELSPLSQRLRPPPEDPDPDDVDYNTGSEQSAADESVDENIVSPLKRAADDTEAYRPLKRQKALLNNDYLNLLNTEIQDAAERVSSEALSEAPLPSQLGLTFWSSIEKQILFESLARLGRDDLEGIANRVGSKSVVEIRHYIHALEEAHSHRLRTDPRPVLTTTEYPAAVELSQQCCYALDEAADAVSLRQERREQQREEGKWGSAWDLTPNVAKRLRERKEDLVDAKDLPSIELFHLSNWLQLSQRFFMNSAVPSSNWNHIDNVPPSIWATTFEDFRSLAVSITRRLVQSAIYAASTRIRSKREHRPVTRNIVKREDVEVAVASLGIPASSRDFWRKSARRLRLDVYKESDESGEPAFMSFEQVEDALSEGVEVKARQQVDAGEHTDLEEEDSGTEYPTREEATDGSGDEEERTIDAEANEVFLYSVADFPNTFRMKGALKSRIATERQQEQFAEDYDQHASYREELEMWDLLQRPPPPGLPKRADPGPAPRSNRDVESLYPLGRDWRNNTRYWEEWEVAPRAEQDEQ